MIAFRHGALLTAVRARRRPKRGIPGADSSLRAFMDGCWPALEELGVVAPAEVRPICTPSLI